MKMKPHRTEQHGEGFTLVELMITVAIIAILMAFSIPIISNARISANEGSAVSSIRTLTSANTTYRTRFGSYAGDFDDLSSSGIIDEVLAASVQTPGKSGYIFTYSVAPGSWELAAQPLQPGVSGQRYFFADTSGVIRTADSVAADSTSKPLDS